VRGGVFEDVFEIFVSNTGDPIPQVALEHLFEPFFRGTNQSGQGGLGLGLYIAAEIAKVYGGTLTVASSSGRNTLQVSDAPSSYDPAR
jgi:sigma-B regulation protein RsbU (phosphoserine phosphatase)